MHGIQIGFANMLETNDIHLFYSWGQFVDLRSLDMDVVQCSFDPPNECTELVTDWLYVCYEWIAKLDEASANTSNLANVFADAMNDGFYTIIHWGTEWIPCLSQVAPFYAMFPPETAEHFTECLEDRYSHKNYCNGQADFPDPFEVASLLSMYCSGNERLQPLSERLMGL
jgi:hypothetical protein